LKAIKIIAAIFMLAGIYGCQAQQTGNAEAEPAQPVRDGVFVHISHGYEDVHRVLMGLQMAALMMETHDVLVYFDIKGIEVVLKDSEDIEYRQFPSSHTQLARLMENGITVMACPGCLKAMDKTPDDLMEGVKVANKDAFFSFTEGRILTIDY